MMTVFAPLFPYPPAYLEIHKQTSPVSGDSLPSLSLQRSLASDKEISDVKTSPHITPASVHQQYLVHMR